MIKRNVFCFAGCCLLMIFFSCNSKRTEKPRVLVFTKTAGYHHSSIPSGIQAIRDLGNSNGFDTDTTSSADFFTEDSLKKYAAVIFLNTTGDLLKGNQETALERYIQAGGGFMGIHAASDAEYDWGWYGRLVGAYFESHPEIQSAKLIVKDKLHPSTQHLPDIWTRTDEWYNFKKISKDLSVLITLDENSYKGGKNGADHPIAWYHSFDGGRAYYTELGHTEESYRDTLYLKHILGGILYAIGDNAKPDYTKAHSDYAPEEDRFNKTQLVEGVFFEPTELAILPNLDVLVAQRRGEIKVYKNETKQVRDAGFLNVYWKTDVPGVNAEEGLLGIKADPEFEKNNWVYLFYSPRDTSVNRLSRFKFRNDSIETRTEQIILQFYSQRDICCHTGGSIAFGPDKSLFLSTGDNTTPFDEPNEPFASHGFAPLDDRPGHLQYDDRRSAANSNDLRGKILRIKMKEDGSYETPEGNLFQKNTPGTRPEIYVMGDRNPYRISVDQKNGFLYWGEVGPDAGADSLDTRGPRGYDEVNQARKAGFFGWPLFIGNNYPYRSYDYSTGVAGPFFDPEKPVNNSRNNTGIKDLPPAQPAFIWYPYANSPDFPSLGTGGRTAMAGPVYYADLFPAETRYPDYYNGKFFFYEWMRGWIKPVTMLPNGDYDKMEPFMEHEKFAAPIDMELGPDGRLYILEYGSAWFAKNPDAGLVRIDYNAGNRPPKIFGLHVDKETGYLPFTVSVKVDARDPDNGPLRYKWNFGDGSSRETSDPQIQYIYNHTGEFAISVEVRDDKNAVAKSGAVGVYAGNEVPKVDILLSGNKSFYFPGKRVGYAVKLEEKDGSASKGTNGLYVMADYIEDADKAAVPIGHLQPTILESGKNLMLSNDCKSCHQVAVKSVGPSFNQVADKYKKDPKAPAYLLNKIKSGGGGVWGETAMAAHPALPENDIRQIVQWVLSLSLGQETRKSLPAAGSLQPTLGKPENEKGTLYLTASYANDGGPGIKPLTGRKTVVLHNSKILFGDANRRKDFESVGFNGTVYMIPPKGEGWVSIDSIDLSNVFSAELSAGYQKPVQYGYVFELHLDTPGGKLLGTAPLTPAASAKNQLNFVLLKFQFETVNDGKFHNLFITSKLMDKNETSQVGLGSLRLLAK
jgi:cytochrome c